MNKPFDHRFYKRITDKVKDGLLERGYDGLLLFDPFNVYYATGFFHIPSERPIAAYIPASGDPSLFIPELEEDHAKENWIEDIRVYFEYPGKVDPVQWICGEIEEDNIAVDDVSQSKFKTIQVEKPNCQLSDVIYELRQCKEPEEIEYVEQAARYADYAVNSAREVISQSVSKISEKEVLKHLKSDTEAKMKSDLEDKPLWFSCGATVHAGERGALPHGTPTDRVVEPGDTVIVGVGASVGGYHAESACTFSIGEPSTEKKEWLDTAFAVRRVPKEEVGPGKRCGDIDNKALDLIRENGFGDYIRHRLGHGIGLENHEAPWVQSGDDTRMREGMVVSSEPGIYVPGEGGVRLIDTFLVTDSGNRLLSQYLENSPEYVIPA